MAIKIFQYNYLILYSNFSTILLNITILISFTLRGNIMITSASIKTKINKLQRLDDLVALNHYVDYLLFREKEKKTEIGQSIISGLKDIAKGKTYSVKSSQDVLKVADEI